MSSLEEAAKAIIAGYKKSYWRGFEMGAMTGTMVTIIIYMVWNIFFRTK